MNKWLLGDEERATLWNEYLSLKAEGSIEDYLLKAQLRKIIEVFKKRGIDLVNCFALFIPMDEYEELVKDSSW